VSDSAPTFQTFGPNSFDILHAELGVTNRHHPRADDVAHIV